MGSIENLKLWQTLWSRQNSTTVPIFSYSRAKDDQSSCADCCSSFRHVVVVSEDDVLDGSVTFQLISDITSQLRLVLLEYHLRAGQLVQLHEHALDAGRAAGRRRR